MKNELQRISNILQATSLPYKIARFSQSPPPLTTKAGKTKLGEAASPFAFVLEFGYFHFLSTFPLYFVFSLSIFFRNQILFCCSHISFG
jgi:hypothetical protein